MIKPDEIEFMKLALQKHDALLFRDLINSININHKRCWYYLEKWTNSGWYNYGVCLDLGWLEPEGIKHFQDMLLLKDIWSRGQELTYIDRQINLISHQMRGEFDFDKRVALLRKMSKFKSLRANLPYHEKRKFTLSKITMSFN